MHKGAFLKEKNDDPPIPDALEITTVAVPDKAVELIDLVSDDDQESCVSLDDLVVLSEDKVDWLPFEDGSEAGPDFIDLVSDEDDNEAESNHQNHSPVNIFKNLDKAYHSTMFKSLGISSINQMRPPMSPSPPKLERVACRPIQINSHKSHVPFDPAHIRKNTLPLKFCNLTESTVQTCSLERRCSQRLAKMTNSRGIRGGN